MWCKQCQSEVAAELAPERQALRCTNCGSTLQQIIAPSLHPETQAARELLERWAREQQAPEAVFIPPAGTNSAEESLSGDHPSNDKLKTRPHSNASVEESQDSRSQRGETASARKIRVDGNHPVPDGPKQSPHRSGRRRPLLPAAAGLANDSDGTSAQENPQEVPANSPLPRHRVDAAHPMGSGPHFEIPVPAPTATQIPGHSESLWGQILAYAGIGVLAFGAVLVLWGYLGGIESYTSTGWLLSTAGQMLLLLGVVTLVAGGMQQTTHEVGQRIDHLGGRIIRIEQSTNQILKGSRRRRPRRRSKHVNDTGDRNEEAA